MGVNCIIRLPRNVRLSDVAKVAGRLSGLAVRKEHFNNNSGWSAKVPGAGAEGHKDIPEMATIRIGFGRHTYFHFEVDDRDDTVLLNPSSCAFWIAIGKGLVDFFGGELIYQDSRTGEPDYAVPFKSGQENRPSDGLPWYDLQERILALKPVTRADLKAADKVASYDGDTLREYAFEDGYLNVEKKKEKRGR